MAVSPKGCSSSGWKGGDPLYARNNAVSDSYLFAWSKTAGRSSQWLPAKPRQQSADRRANSTSDGRSQMF